jgi:membrane-associated phospholipid phosphatase
MALPIGRGLIVLGLVALLLVCAVGLDDDMTVWAAQAKTPILDLLVGIIDPIGRGVTLLVACAALALLAWRCGRTRLCEAARLGALAFMYAGLVEFTLKHLVGRPRPNAALAATVGVLGPSWTPDVDSFPSGHATSVFAVAAVFGTFYPRLRLPLYALAAAVALGRVYLERHYLSDVVAGAVLGVIVAVWLHRRRQAGRTGVDPEAGR